MIYDHYENEKENSNGIEYAEALYSANKIICKAPAIIWLEYSELSGADRSCYEAKTSFHVDL